MWCQLKCIISLKQINILFEVVKFLKIKFKNAMESCSITECFQTISHMSWKNEDWATVTIAWNLELLSVWGCHSCKSCQEMPLFTTYISLPDRQTNTEWCYDVMMLLDTWYLLDISSCLPSLKLTAKILEHQWGWFYDMLLLRPSLFSGKWSPTCHWAHAQHLHHRPEGTLAQIMTLGETSNFGVLIPYTRFRQFSTQIWLHTFRWMGISMAKRCQKFNIPR